MKIKQYTLLIIYVQWIKDEDAGSGYWLGEMTLHYCVCKCHYFDASCSTTLNNCELHVHVHVDLFFHTQSLIRIQQQQLWVFKI